MGPQFAHVQTYSRKANPAGQSVDQVFDEVTRNPDFSYHVENPSPPEVVDGISPEQLRSEHDDMIATAFSLVMVKGEPKQRKVRKDRHTLVTAVVSYPLTWDEVAGNEIEEAALHDWEARNVAFFREQFGDHYRAAYRHTDEARPHLHIYGLPVGIDGIDATRLHPGKSAKKAVEARLKAEGVEPRKAVAAGNREFRVAMRDWQDAYYRAVGEPCGLLRTGPKRQRLSRAQYQAQMVEARLRSTSALEKRRLVLEEAARLTQAQATTQREIDQALRERQAELDARDRLHMARERELHAAVKMLQGAAQRMRRIVAVVGGLFGLSASSSLSEGLTAIEAVVEKVQESGSEAPTPRPDGDGMAIG